MCDSWELDVGGNFAPTCFRVLQITCNFLTGLFRILTLHRLHRLGYVPIYLPTPVWWAGPDLIRIPPPNSPLSREPMVASETGQSVFENYPYPRDVPKAEFKFYFILRVTLRSGQRSTFGVSTFLERVGTYHMHIPPILHRPQFKVLLSAR